ncbi:HDOD domain-containing protein [Solidesulfovibrio sp.]|uniref:HDOD domain-containing protein n=2 Tax=Solidesulfovibrio sp. TaxID=2910990 RepID=UPI002B21D4CA|nr:HDOD domain-containing protein [Solidesulfovibrio sp.]MEA4855154.1 HDOD domain-containing protein [Solidesulfovibrio sp.]
MMARVNIDELRPGMVLGRDVCGKNGRMLLSAGTVLEPSHLRVLRIWGVSAVCLARGREPATAAGAGETADGRERAREALAARFALTDRAHPAVAALYRFCLRDLARTDRCPLPAKAPPAVEDAALPPAPGDPEALVADDPSLASFPDIYFRLRQAIDDPGASAGRIAGIIGDDPGLAARLLRLANSPFYGLTRPIDSLARGVLRIGAGELAQLALGVAVVERFRDIPACCLTMRQIWEHAVGCGVLARVLGAHVGGISQERLFVSGLLHDLGRLVLLRRLPRHMALAMHLARERSEPLFAVERALLGFDHAAVGRALLELWHLPPELAAAVGDHHLDRGMDLDAAIVHVADVATVAMGLGSNGSPLVPPLSCAAWERLGIEPDTLAVALSQSRRQVDDIVASLLG